MPSEARAGLRLIAWAPVGALGIIGVMVAWWSLPWPLVHDAPILHYIARRIAVGDVPYRDLFDMNQPGAYLLHLGVVSLLGDGDFAWRAFDLGWLVITAIAAAVFARPWGVVAAAGAGVLFAVYHLSGGAWQAGQRDYLICVLLLGAAGAAVAWLESDGVSARWLAAAGGMLGVAITVKPHATVFAIALGVLLALAARRRPAGARAVVWYAAGLVAAPLGVGAWLVASGGFAAWTDIVFAYLIPLYSRLTRPDDWRFWRVEVWYALAAAVVISLALALRDRRFGWRHGVATLGLAYGVVHYVGQRKGWEYHLYPLAAFAAVLAFSEVEALLSRRRVIAGGLLVLILGVTTVLLGLRGRDAVNAAWIWDKEMVVRRLVADLSLNLRPADRVQMLDTAEGGTHALLRLGLPSATRFLYDFHFFHDAGHPTIERFRDEFVRALSARPPRFVVVFAQGWPEGKLDRITRFAALNAFLETNYRAVHRRPAYLILEARPRS